MSPWVFFFSFLKESSTLLVGVSVEMSSGVRGCGRSDQVTGQLFLDVVYEITEGRKERTGGPK